MLDACRVLTGEGADPLTRVVMRHAGQDHDALRSSPRGCCVKAMRVYARSTAFYTKAAAVDVMGNCHRRSATRGTAGRRLRMFCTCARCGVSLQSSGSDAPYCSRCRLRARYAAQSAKKARDAPSPGRGRSVRPVSCIWLAQRPVDSVPTTAARRPDPPHPISPQRSGRLF